MPQPRVFEVLLKGLDGSPLSHQAEKIPNFASIAKIIVERLRNEPGFQADLTIDQCVQEITREASDMFGSIVEEHLQEFFLGNLMEQGDKILSENVGDIKSIVNGFMNLNPYKKSPYQDHECKRYVESLKELTFSYLTNKESGDFLCPRIPHNFTDKLLCDFVGY